MKNVALTAIAFSFLATLAHADNGADYARRTRTYAAADYSVQSEKAQTASAEVSDADYVHQHQGHGVH